MTKEKSITGGQQWQPIEMAPKDGTRILVSEDDMVQEAYFNDYGQCFKAQTYSSDFVDGQIYAPTHWMPLPQPPKGGME